MHTLPSRLLPAAKIVFSALNKSGAKGIIFGGAAAAMNGSTRQTKVRVLSQFQAKRASC